MNWPPWVSLLMSVWVNPSRYLAFKASLPKFANSLAQPSVTLIGQPSPNSAWLNKNVKGAWPPPDRARASPKCPCAATSRECRIRRTPRAPARDRPDDTRSTGRRGQNGRAGAAPARAGRPAARIRRDDRRQARPSGRDAARYGGIAHRANECEADPSAPDRRDKNSSPRYPAPAIPAARPTLSGHRV